MLQSGFRRVEGALVIGGLAQETVWLVESLTDGD